MGYGTGAIMAVPGQDERDWEFAEGSACRSSARSQPPEGWTARRTPARARPSTPPTPRSAWTGWASSDAKARIIDWLESTGPGRAHGHLQAARLAVQPAALLGRAVPDRLRRGRHCRSRCPSRCCRSSCPRSTTSRRRPSPRTTSRASRSRRWRRRRLGRRRAGPGRRAASRYRRETNMMPQWAGSCWYELRYLDPTNDEASSTRTTSATGWVPQCRGRRRRRRPVRRRRRARRAAPAVRAVLAQGAVRPGPRLERPSRSAGCSTRATSRPTRTPTSAACYVPAAEVDRDGRGHRTPGTGEPVNREYGKMGKSLKNVVTPDEMCDAYGADTFRVYEMSMGPLDVSRPWETRAVVGSYRFLQRRVAQRRRRGDRRAAGRRRAGRRGDAPAAAPHHRRGPHRHGRRCGSTPPSPG